ncbi:MAG: hypothetical protein WHS44_04535 [Fimbriimonadales bacterium]|nr:MAG: hypothetical protein KatS3mg018_0008 [Fimbriimonadales bacterium]
MALTTAGTQPAIEYPSTDGEPLAQNTRQYRWVVTIQGAAETPANRTGARAERLAQKLRELGIEPE